MLTVHRSNSLDVLADRLAAVLRDRPLPPLCAEPIVVQSLGMQRWLNFALAARLGVAAHLGFEFPAAFAAQLFAAVLPGSPPSRIFEREVLGWRVAAVLPALLDMPEFAALAHYVDGENRALKTFQLAMQTGRVLDRYLAFRASMLLDWSQGGGDGWQPVLWRAVAGDHAHAPLLARQFRDRVRDRAAQLPPRFSIFGAASLGPFFLDVFAEAARHTEAHLFLLTPTPEYWGENLSEREQARILRKRGAGAIAHAEVGHPLLSSLGKIGREFFRAVVGLDETIESEDFREPAGATALASLQRDIFELKDRTGPDAERHTLEHGDSSIQLHVAHSPLRETEILHDRLLALFAEGVAPREVLVLMPDVDTYAPFIEAVFGSPESPRLRIPFSIADRAAARENSVAQAFLALLALAGSRFSAPDVLALLDLAPVRARFGIVEDNLPWIRTIVARARIRWGKDAAQRTRCRLPAFAENSWRPGLDRLLLGFALPGDGRTLFEGILPEPVAEGSQARTLGNFAQFIATLFRQIEGLGAPRAAGEWTMAFRALLDAFVAPAEIFATERREVIGHIDAIAEYAALAAGAGPAKPMGADALDAMTIDVVRAHLRGALEGTDRAGAGFLSGGVTFCSMKPMRSIPHRVIAMLGVDGDVFPRRQTAPPFDRVANEPRPGDRSPRDDDRQIFIEAVLAARDVLYLSHVGLSAKANAELPPSPIVAEFLAHLDAAFVSPDTRSPSARITTVHPLQAFSPRAFRAPNFSYSAENARACAAGSAVRVTRGAVIPALAAEIETGPEITLDALGSCLVHPARFFGRVRGIRLPGEEPDAEDCEPFKLEGLERYHLRRELATAALSGVALQTIEQAFQSSGALPPAYPGLSALREAAADAEQFARRVIALAPGPSRPPIEVNARVDDSIIRGTLDGVRGNRLVCARPAQLKAKDLLRAWLSHLVLCAAAPDGIERRTLIIDETKQWELAGIADPLGPLREILRLYRAAHAAPVRFFPECSLAYAKCVPPKNPRAAAAAKWKDDFSRAEGDEEWNEFFFGHETVPFDETFDAWARSIFGPLLAALSSRE